MGKQYFLIYIYFLLIATNLCEVCSKTYLYPRVEKYCLRKHTGLTMDFKANYFAMACLQYTSVASTTVLTSTSGKLVAIECGI